MQVTETAAEGLKRTITVTVPMADLAARFETRLADLKDRVQIKGFRKGHVPAVHLKKLYGRSVMGEVLDETIRDTSARAIEERKERPAMEPEIKLPEDEAQLKALFDGQADLSYSMSFEVLPRFEITDLTQVTLEKVVAEVPDADVDAQLRRLADENTTFTEDADRVAEAGDRVVIDFVGRIDGIAFEGGSGTAVELVLGQARFIPGFEDGLVGARAGETRNVDVTFPADYGNADLAGKPATFEITVTSVAVPSTPAIDDAFAATLGATDLATLRQMLTARMQRELDRATRVTLKRELLDALDRGHTFELPQSLVDVEFDAIWKELTATLERDGKTLADEGKSEDAARAEYRRIAERRVRLGLIVGELGDRHKVEVTKEELQVALIEQARRYPGRERMVYEYFEKTPGAVAQLRAPIYEEKVVDLMLAQIVTTPRTVTPEELMRLATAAGEA
jgi:trigger factor